MTKKEQMNQKEALQPYAEKVTTPELIEGRLKSLLRSQNDAKMQQLLREGADRLIPPEEVQKNMADFAKALKEYTEQVDEFYSRKNGHTGEGYKMVERVLKNYLDYKWIRKNRGLRFGQTPLGPNVTLKSIPIGKGKSQVVAHLLDDNGNEIQELTLEEIKRELERRGSISKTEAGEIGATQADIYYMLCIAENTDWSAKTLNAYLTSYKPKLEVAIVLMIELLVEDMESETSSETIRKYGRLIRHVYMEEESAGKDRLQLAKELGYESKRTFYNHKDAAISLIAKFVFGICPGEYGLANIVLKDGRYVFADLEELKDEKSK